MNLILGALQLGFIYALLAIGVYITFRILNIPDLTVDGSFVFGLSVSAIFTFNGHPVIGILLGMLAGMLAGAVTGLLQTKCGIHPILAGILTMSGLASINMFVMNNQANITLLNSETVFSMMAELLSGLKKGYVKLILAVIICLIIVCLVALFFRTDIGLCIRATGDNEAMCRASSINVETMKIIAIALANGCVALSGAVLAQYQGYADVNCGAGTIVVGLASVIIGEVFWGRRSVLTGIISAVTGSVVYQFLIALALWIDIFPQFALKLISAVIVAIALSIPTIRKKWGEMRFRRRNQ